MARENQCSGRHCACRRRTKGGGEQWRVHHTHTHTSESQTHRETFQMQSEDKEDESGRWSGERQVTFRAQSEHVMTRHKDPYEPGVWQQLVFEKESVCVVAEQGNRFKLLYTIVFNCSSWNSGQRQNRAENSDSAWGFNKRAQWHHVVVRCLFPGFNQMYL